MYHGFYVSCSSSHHHAHTQTHRVQTHLRTGICVKKKFKKKKSTQCGWHCSRSCLVWKQTSLETFPSESFIKQMTSEDRFGWRKCLSSAQQIGTLHQTTSHQGTLNRSPSFFYHIAFSSVLSLTLILFFSHWFCTNMTKQFLGQSRWIQFEVASVVLDNASCL